MSDIINAKELRYLKEILRECAEYQRKRNSDNNFKVFEKDDGSPVTDVDLWSNEFLNEKLSAKFPGIPYIGEENEDHSYPLNSEYIWFVDPIDGTKHFIEKRGQFFILIGLVRNGKPIAGFYLEPKSGTLVYTLPNTDVLTISLWKPNEADKKMNINVETLPNHLTMKRIPAELRNQIASKSGFERSRYMDDVHAALAPLFNRSSGLLMNRKTHFWDICAPAAIMNNMGFDIQLVKDGHNILMNKGNLFCDFVSVLPKESAKNVLPHVPYLNYPKDAD